MQKARVVGVERGLRRAALWTGGVLWVRAAGFGCAAQGAQESAGAPVARSRASEPRLYVKARQEKFGMMA